MSTEVQNILPIPESVVVGVGSYIIPADKYGFLSMSVSCAARGWSAGRFSGDPNTSTGTGSAAANSNHQHVPEGTVIDSTAVEPTDAAAVSSVHPFASVTIDGSDACVANANGAAAINLANFVGGDYGSASNARRAWSVSIFPIPKNNLPPELITP